MCAVKHFIKCEVLEKVHFIYNQWQVFLTCLQKYRFCTPLLVQFNSICEQNLFHWMDLNKLTRLPNFAAFPNRLLISYVYLLALVQKCFSHFPRHWIHSIIDPKETFYDGTSVQWYEINIYFFHSFPLPFYTYFLFIWVENFCESTVYNDISWVSFFMAPIKFHPFLSQKMYSNRRKNYIHMYFMWILIFFSSLSICHVCTYLFLQRSSLL